MATKSKKPETVTAIENPDEKRKALDTAISQIKKAKGAGSIMRLGDNVNMNVQAIPTGSLTLDLALGIGGVPRGRIVEIYGPESSGKTTVALHIIAETQKMGGEAAFIDAEHALDPLYAKALGVNINDKRTELIRIKEPRSLNRAELVKKVYVCDLNRVNPKIRTYGGRRYVNTLFLFHHFCSGSTHSRLSYYHFKPPLVNAHSTPFFKSYA